mmetsp:Transcript_22646/g.31960  ORF Transcript_22646/g.31960 Transcript_22646/m.31960 type:complete len:145 (+) Transcript_22646:144-578(+)
MVLSLLQQSSGRSVMRMTSFAHASHKKNISNHMMPSSLQQLKTFFNINPPFFVSRSYWQEIVRVSLDPKDPSKQKYEDPELATKRSSRAQSAEGLQRRGFKYLRYEKPWMKKKRLKQERIYKTKVKGVEELQMYIKFVQNGEKK